jgi:hypothetical protein
MRYFHDYLNELVGALGSRIALIIGSAVKKSYN